MLTALEGPCEDVRPMARASRASHFNIHDLAADSDLLLLKLMTTGQPVLVDTCPHKIGLRRVHYGGLSQFVCRRKRRESGCTHILVYVSTGRCSLAVANRFRPLEQFSFYPSTMYRRCRNILHCAPNNRKRQRRQSCRIACMFSIVFFAFQK